MPTPTCDPGGPLPCDTDTPSPIPTPTCDPLIGCATDTPSPTPTCDAGAGVACDTPTETATDTLTSTDTPTPTGTSQPPTPTKTPVFITYCPPTLTGVFTGAIAGGVSPGSGTADIALSYVGTAVAGNIEISGAGGLPSEPLTGTVICGQINLNTASGSMHLGGRINPDGTTLVGAYVAAPSDGLRIGDSGARQASLDSTDSDGDGYPDVLESAMNKDPLAYCSVMRADVNTDGKVMLADLIIEAGWYNKAIPPAPARYDQNADGKIELADLIIMAGAYNHSVSSCP